MAYLYETHMHTCRGSACGVSTGVEHVHYYKELGYTGIIITEHFYGGNTCIDRSLPWEQFVDGIWSGYEEAKEEGDKIGLDVFFGYEQNYEYDEYLIYGLSKEYMKSRPDLPFWTRKQQLEEVHAAGGCVVQAHPFRIRGYMDKIRISPLYCDGVEVANAANDSIDDARCMRYAMEHGFAVTAGSDNHRSPKTPTFGVALDRKLTDINEFVQMILSREKMGLHVTEGRFDDPADFAMDERHIAYRIDENEKTVLSEKQWLIEL